jgi:uncharacterized membrane protein YphA (DoxX/SURF4 family)
MRTNPFYDTYLFLTTFSWTTAVFWLLLIGGILIALMVWGREPEQRTTVHFGNWIARLIIGGMWWQQTLWKLPPNFDTDGTGGLRYWMQQMAENAAFSWQSAFVRHVCLPNYYIFGSLVYAGEVAVAVSLIFGLFTRLGATIGALMAINLWFGLYRAPSEWPWTYFFLVTIQALFALHGVGRSLGFDSLLVPQRRSAIRRSRLLKMLSG